MPLVCPRAPCAHVGVQLYALKVIVVSIVNVFPKCIHHIRAHKLLKYANTHARVMSLIHRHRHTAHRHPERYRDDPSGHATAQMTHAHANLATRERIAPPRAASRGLQRQRDANRWPIVRPAGGLGCRVGRRGRLLRALLAAAGGARRLQLLLHQVPRKRRRPRRGPR